MYESHYFSHRKFTMFTNIKRICGCTDYKFSSCNITILPLHFDKDCANLKAFQLFSFLKFSHFRFKANGRGRGQNFQSADKFSRQKDRRHRATPPAAPVYLRRSDVCLEGGAIGGRPWGGRWGKRSPLLKDATRGRQKTASTKRLNLTPKHN